MTSLVGLSEYEVLRLQNIQRNRTVLENLGLTELRDGMKSVVGKRSNKSVAKRKETVSVFPTRKSKRLKSVPPKDYSESSVHIDDGYVSAYRSESGDSGSDDSEEAIPRPKRLLRQRLKLLESRLDSNSGDCVKPTANSVITVESAKTGRSRCRKCMVELEKGEVRVGMKAWIMGRNSVTWQHVECFLKNVKVGISPNGRSSCKFCSQPFCSGDLRFGLRSHTATSWVSADCLKPVLEGVLTHQMKSKLSTIFDHMDGVHSLTKSQQERAQAVVEDCVTSMTERKGAESPKPKEEVKSESPNRKDKTIPPNPLELQPVQGKKTRATGRVAWTFGGHVCFGVLLAERESKTHCFAKTHKGNVKTLTKGKGYWWLQ